MAKTPKKKRELIYVIAGKEPAAVNAECDKILGGLLGTREKMTGLFAPDAAKVSASEVLDELRTLPFLADKRVVVLRTADEFITKNRQLLEHYFDNPSTTGILVMTVNSWPSNTKLAKKLSSVGKLIAITQPKPWQLPARLIQYAEGAHSKKLDKPAAELLIELTGDNLGALYAEIDKLSLYAADEKVINPQHVESLIGHNRMYNVFGVIDAMTAGNTTTALQRLRDIFAQDESADYSIIGAFAFHFRRMFNAKVLLQQGLNSSQIAGKLRIWSNKDDFFSQLGKVTLGQIGSNIKRLAAADFAIKTGRAKAKIAVEQIVLQLSAG